MDKIFCVLYLMFFSFVVGLCVGVYSNNSLKEENIRYLGATKIGENYYRCEEFVKDDTIL